MIKIKLKFIAKTMAASVVTGAILTTTSVVAQIGSAVMEEVLVTAERREANLQDVPIAMNAFSGDALEEYQVADVGDLQSLVPNLSIHVGDANNAVAYIRGVGQIDSVAFFEPGVGMYLDDVYLGRAQGAFLSVIDVERIEVLRGPQGSLYGRNTVGGAIKYVSASPTEELSGNAVVTMGDYGRADFKGSVSGPLSDVLSGRLTAAKLTRDGFSYNQFDGDDDGDLNTSFIRGVLQAELSDKVSAILSVDYTKNDPDHSRTPAKETDITVTTVDPFTFGLTFPVYEADVDPFLVNADFNNTEETETQGIDLKVSWQISDSLTLKSITSFRELDYGTELDLDGTPQNAFGIFYFNDQEQTSQEFQLNWDKDEFSAILGLYYFNEQGSTFDGGVFNNLLIATSGVSEFNTDSYALFGQIDYDLSDRLTATLGFRYTEEEKEYQRQVEDYDLTALAGIFFNPDFSVGYTNPELLNPRSSDIPLGQGLGTLGPLAVVTPADFSNFSPKVGLKYKLGENAQVYGNVSTGFKSGGFNGRVANSALEPFDEETLTSYELGYKSQLMDNRVRFNAAIFYNDYEDLQVSSFEVTADGLSILPIFTNAGKAAIQGVEFDVSAILTEGLTLNANVGFLDAEYKEFLGAADPVTNEVLDISDQRSMVNAPDVDANLGLVYDMPLENYGTLRFMGDISYRDKTYLEVNSSENLAQDAYSVINAAIVFNSNDGHWQIILGGKNLSDKNYRSHAFDLSAFPGVELGYYNAPRTYSLSAKYSF